LKDIVLEGGVIFKRILNAQGEREWTAFIWLSTDTNEGLLWMW